MLVTEAIYDYIAERQLFDMLQVLDQWRLGPGRLITQQALAAGIWPDVQFIDMQNEILMR